MESVCCIICGSDDCRILFKAEDLLFGEPGVFNVVECTQCGLYFTNPRPKKQELLKYYPDNYAPYRRIPPSSFVKKQKIKIKLSELPVLGSFLKKKLLDSKAFYIPDFPSKANILELGCATGNFLTTLKGRGWHLCGLEINEKAAQYAQTHYGLDVFCGTLEEANFPSNYFDIIFAWMVLEHLTNPLETLIEIHRILKKDGYLAFSIPNAGCWEWKIFKNNWYALQVPSHLFHYTIKTATLLLDKAGFKVEKIEYQRNVHNIIASIGYLIKDKWGNNKIATWLKEYPHKAGNIFIDMLLFPIKYFFAFIKQSGRITVIVKPK